MAVPKYSYIISYNGLTIFTSSNCKWLYTSLINNKKELGITKFVHYATCMRNVAKGEKVPFTIDKDRILYMYRHPCIQKIQEPDTMLMPILI